MTYVAVCGPAAAGPVLVDHARRAGRLLADRGWVVLTGGHGGVMAGVAEGVADAGGTAIALLPGTDRAEASPGHAFTLPTGLGEMRNALLVRCADAVLAIGASWGTLSEVALAARTGVPLAVVDGEVPAFAGPEVAVAASVDAAIAVLEERLGDRQGEG